jgi:8-oxo-dGTP diphosphatase
MPRRYPTRPYVGVGVVVFRDDRVLLVRRGTPPRRHGWSIPGGAQEIDETVRETAHRELFEETGITVTLLGLVDVVDSITRDDEGRVLYHYTLVDFAARWQTGEAVAGDDVAEIAWAALDDLGRFDLWAETTRIIDLAGALRGR